MTQRKNRPGAPAGIRRIAVLTALAFGCSTVRVPASTMAATVPVRGGVADPQLELWLESGGAVSPEESARATAQAKEALRSALAGASAPDGDAVLVVRAQGVARTASRRTDQRAAIAGIVVGAVAIVAAVVVILVASNGKSAPKVALPRLTPAARVPVPRVPARVPAPIVPGHIAHPPPIDANVFVGIQIPPPGSPQATPLEQGVEVVPEAAAWSETAWAPPPDPRPELAEIALPPPRPLPLDARGFFDGDMVRLELAVVDRHDGTLLWTKAVEADVDPRDARAVQALLARALAEGEGWTPSP